MDSLQIEQSVRQVLSLKGDGRFAKAHELADSFYQVLLKDDDEHYSKGRITFTRGRVEIDLGNYDASIASARQSIAYFTKGNHQEDIAGSYNLMGVGFYFKNQLDSTLVYYNKSFQLKRQLNVSKEALAISAYNLGIVYEDTGKFNEAIKTYRSAAEYLNGATDEKFLADVYLGLANTYKHMRDYSNAEQYADLALAKAVLRYGEDNPAITFFYVSYSSVLTVLEEYNKAAAFLNQTIKLRNKYFGQHHLWTAEAYLNLGKLSRITNDFNQAEQVFQKAIDIQKVNKNIYSTIAQFELAQLYDEQGQKKQKILQLTNKYIDEITSIYGGQNQDVASGYLLMAKTVEDSSLFFQYLTRARTSANYTKKQLHEVLAPYVALESLVVESKHIASHCQDACSLDVLNAQFKLIPEQIELIQYMYNSYAAEESKIQLGKYCKDILGHGIGVCFQMYQLTDSLIFIERALELSELNRNTILLKGIQENRFKLLADVDSVDIRIEKLLMEREAALHLSIAYERSSEEPSIEVLNHFYEQRSRLRHSQDSLSYALENKYPRLKKLRTLQLDVDIKRLQSQLGAKEQFICYFLGKDNGYVFSITSIKCLFVRLNDVDLILETAQSLENQIVRREPIDRSASLLYNQVLNVVSLEKNHDLVFILDNILNAIPFEILIDSAGKYLIESHAIRYAGSLQLIDHMSRLEHKSAAEWVGFSPSYVGDLALFNTKPEVMNIGQLFSGQVFTDSAATKTAFLNSVNGADILHLAMHTAIDNKNPMLSTLLFHEEPMYASEVYNQKLPAAMVVLSACESGRGKLASGEGVMSLSRAFSYAGVASTVMSLWKIPDKQTPKIMVPFYKHLKAGKTKSHALRLAKIQYLKETKQATLRHPFYWAGFVLNGDDSSLKQSFIYWYFLLAGFSTIAILGFYIWKRKKRNTLN